MELAAPTPFHSMGAAFSFNLFSYVTDLLHGLFLKCANNNCILPEGQAKWQYPNGVRLLLACFLLKNIGTQKMSTFVWQSYQVSVIVCVASFYGKGLFGVSHLWPGPMQAKAVNLVRRGTEQP